MRVRKRGGGEKERRVEGGREGKNEVRKRGGGERDIDIDI